MRLILSLCVLFVSANAAIEEDEGVLVLTNDNFDEAISGHEFILVEFYAPWCGHCKALAPEYAKAAQALAKEESNVKLAKLDATVHDKVAQKFGVRGYPTLKFFRNGKDSEYGGGRTKDEIVNWLKKKTGPPATNVETVEAAEKAIEGKDVVIVGFFKDQESKDAKAFLSFAGGVDDYPFVISSADDVISKYEAADGKVVMIKTFDEKRHELEGDINDENLKAFIAKYSLPLVVEFNQETAQKIFGGEIKAHLLMFLSKKSEDFAKHTEAASAVAKEQRGKILVVSIDTDEEDHARIMEFFGMKAEEVPALRIIKMEEDMTKYKPEKTGLEEATIRSFVEDFLADKLKQHLLSQDLPEDWDKAGVKVLVSSNFDEVALDKKKDVLVEFYAPWCGHCKQLVPIYDELGEKYKDSETVVIAKMDATANELEHTKIQSFPTIKLWKKETNEIVEYGGDRKLESLVKFVESGGVEGKATESEAEAEDEEEAEGGEVEQRE
ncbi:protein disulfide-isomerase-like isoform X1 [Amphibalanus amphitrite]|uniref:protein disulfide-isomerase-like isoform X1 n=1 Tax=Amphibalanus amphitrite TaxID=1232801 RepID=UPI001C90BFCF|nr:protein disulfide-isomerase-like isoform X1 [Amphibalanus amphitrite]